MAAARAQDAGHRMRIEEERQRRAQGERRIDAIGARGVRPGRGEQELRRRHGGEDLAVAAELDRHDDHRGKGGDVDQHVLDDGDRRRRAQAARIGEGGENDEGDDERQVPGQARAGDAHRADHHLDADELQRDIGHRRDDAGHRDRQRQPAVAEPAAHEIGGGDVAVLVHDAPQPRKHQEQQRIDDDRVGHREERDGAGAEGQRRHGDEGVGGIEIAADQEPGDDGAEAPPAEAPLVQQVEIAPAPARGGEAEPGDEAEQQHEDDESRPVDLQPCAVSPLHAPSARGSRWRNRRSPSAPRR